MIHTIKTIDYKNAKFTDKEIEDFCKKMGYITEKDLVPRALFRDSMKDLDSKKK